MISKKMCVMLGIIMALVLSACSFDQRYRYEANGNEDYLNTAPLKPIAIPAGLSFPKLDDKYAIYMPETQGKTGLNVDIFPPLLPLATLENSFATYRDGKAYLDAPAKTPLWEVLQTRLTRKRVAIQSRNDHEIITGEVVELISAREIPYKATYRIRYQKKGARQQLTVELLSLMAGKQDIFNNAIYKQRYTVSFFNDLMLNLKQNSIRKKS